ncbi:MAG: hypothetical protein ACOYU5_13970 [Stygiobacter sp.]
MLPPKLAKVKRNLDAKGMSRTSEENALLEELKELDRRLVEGRDFNERIEKAFGGPSNTCPCCGRSI